MKKSLLLFVALLLISISLSALEPARISIVTTPDESTGKTLKVDILQSDGSLFVPEKTIYINDDGTNGSIFGTLATTNASGTISFVLSHSTWTDIVLDETSKNYLVRVTYGTMVLSIERMEVVIAKQSQYGAKISPSAINQTENFTFQKIGILESGSTPSDKTIIQGGTQTGNITYTLPNSLPTSNGQVLSCSTSGVLSWVTPRAGVGPFIESTSLASNIAGAEILIYGIGFGSTQGSSVVSFSEVPASEYTSWISAQIKVKVPDITANTIKLSVTVDGIKSNELDFSILPYVSTISPTESYTGGEITLTGTGFGSTQGTSVISFNGADATVITSWSDTQIKVKVPDGAINGNVSITVNGLKSNENTCLVCNERSSYSSITIGTQVWMGENLDVCFYRNGDFIPQVQNATQWAALTTGAWCYIENDANNGTTYGKLYNWYAVNDSRGLAPIGWHIPSDEEWSTLSANLGGASVAGGKLKTTGTIEAGDGLWSAPNTGATNETGFSGLPGSWRDNFGNFYALGAFAYWWSSNEFNSTNARYCYLNCLFSSLTMSDYPKKVGFSVRCVKD